MGTLDSQFFVAFAWGTLTFTEKGVVYAHWPEMGLWSCAELLGLVVPMFCYCIMHIQRPYLKNWFGIMLYNVFQGSLVVIAILFSFIQYKLAVKNFPPSVLLLSMNVMYLPVVVILFALVFCKQYKVANVTFVVERE